MLTWKSQLVAGAIIVGGGIIALTFARWFMDDFILVVAIAGGYLLGKYSKPIGA